MAGEGPMGQCTLDKGWGSTGQGGGPKIDGVVREGFGLGAGPRIDGLWKVIK